MSLCVVTFKWKPRPGYRSKFEGRHVNILAHMLQRHLRQPHRLICFTDDPAGIDASLVDVRELWNDHANLVNPSAPERGPSCYRRLKIFSRDAGEWLGERILAIDLDVVILNDMSRIVGRSEPFVIWGDTSPPTPYNGGLILFTAGVRPELWEDFDPAVSPSLGKRLGYFGSDQAWISFKIGKGNASVFSQSDGVYSYRNYCVRNRCPPPPNASVVSFHGHVDPDSREAQMHDWVRRNYR